MALAEGYVPVDNAMEKKGSKDGLLFLCVRKGSHDCCSVKKYCQYPRFFQHFWGKLCWITFYYSSSFKCQKMQALHNFPTNHHASESRVTRYLAGYSNSSKSCFISQLCKEALEESINSMLKRVIKGDLHPAGIASWYAAKYPPHTVSYPSGSRSSPRRIQPSQQRKQYMGWKQRATQSRWHLLLLPSYEPNQRNLLFRRSFRRFKFSSCFRQSSQSNERMVNRLL